MLHSYLLFDLGAAVCNYIASFPGSSLHMQIITRMTFDPPERKVHSDCESLLKERSVFLL